MSFLPLKSNSVTITLNYLLDSIPAIMSSNTINTSISLFDSSLLNFHKYYQFLLNNQWMLLDFLIFFFLISNSYLDSNGCLTCKETLSKSGSWGFIMQFNKVMKFNNALVFPDPEPPRINIFKDIRNIRPIWIMMYFQQTHHNFSSLL